MLSTVHSAKGQEWEAVYVLNVADGNFPTEFATGKPEQIEEERRLLYVAMTRAKTSLDLIAPLKYYVTQQSRMGDRHVYGARSRFLTKAVMACLEEVAYGEPDEAENASARNSPRWTSPGGCGGCGRRRKCRIDDLDQTNAQLPLTLRAAVISWSRT